jgi:hypothetical protein
MEEPTLRNQNNGTRRTVVGSESPYVEKGDVNFSSKLYEEEPALGPLLSSIEDHCMSQSISTAV